MRYFNAVTHIGRWRLGVTHDLITERDEPYLERWILWCGITLRVHKFLKSDDDRVFHDHPWWFVSVPFAAYHEYVPDQPVRIVKPWRTHFRRAHHRHIVKLIAAKPVRTLILTGPKVREWGFWQNDNFIHHQEWLDPPC